MGHEAAAAGSGKHPSLRMPPSQKECQFSTSAAWTGEAVWGFNLRHSTFLLRPGLPGAWTGELPWFNARYQNHHHKRHVQRTGEQGPACLTNYTHVEFDTCCHIPVHAHRAQRPSGEAGLEMQAELPPPAPSKLTGIGYLHGERWI